MIGPKAPKQFDRRCKREDLQIGERFGSSINFSLSTDVLIHACLFLIAINSEAARVWKHQKAKSNYELHNYDSDDDKNFEEGGPPINLQGSLRREFAIQVGLIAPALNAVCSPMSALLPLSKLSLGAKGSTRGELLNAVGFTRGELVRNIKKLIRDLRSTEGIILDIVSRMFVSQTSVVNPDFEQQATNIFGSSVDRISFQNVEKAVETINEYVATQTRDKIKNLLTPDDVSPQVSIILVNAIYFQGNWKHEFKKAVPAKFYTPKGSLNVPMMKLTAVINYVKSRSLSAQIIELPYKKSNASFIVVLPEEIDGLPSLLTTLKQAPSLLNTAMMGMRQTYVKVQLPKFKVTTKLNLKALYKKIGVTRIFSDEHGELDSILKGTSVSVSSAIQKAVIDVSETGTEAAAATAITTFFSGTGGKELFKADHPFLFFVLVNSEQLFSGIFSNQN